MPSSLRRHFPSMLFALAISPDGRLLATGDKVGHIVVWDVESGRSLATLEAPELYTWDPVQRRHSIGGIRSLAFSPDGKITRSRRQRQDLEHRSSGWQGPGGSLRLAKRRAHVHTFASDKFKGLVEHLSFHPKGDWLLAGGGGDKDGFLMFFNVAAKKTLAQEKAPMDIHDLALNEASDTIYAVGHRKIVVFGMKG